MPIKDTIKKLRTDKKLTQETFAEKLHCNRQKIADWERGKSAPSAEDLVLLSKVFDVSADYILGISDTFTTDSEMKFVCNYTGLSEGAVNFLRFTNLTHDLLNSLLSDSTGWLIMDFAIQIAEHKVYLSYLNKHLQELGKTIDNCNNEKLRAVYKEIRDLGDKKDLAEFKLQQIHTSIVKQYCKDEIESYEKLKDIEHKLLEIIFADMPDEPFETEHNDDK